MRIVGWNIRAGGGRRAEGIAAQLAAWRPDLVVLSEFRGGQASRSIAGALAEQGLAWQRASADARQPSVNALLVASRWPLRRLPTLAPPSDPCRWLPVRVAAPQPFRLLAVHVPNRATGRKVAFLETIAAQAERWHGHAAMVIGDTNTGRIGLDEQAAAFNAYEDAWMRRMGATGWADAFRHQRGGRREFTWYSPNAGNGFRLDQAFVQAPLLARLASFEHRWGGSATVNRSELSDHAAMVLGFSPR
ncbi:MAG: endonuclease/exonuclease/phosphatase family protein [Burkholderiaceae bacterium]